ncbi:MAG TPA: hypothetical protein VLT47_06925 [Anaeromyxobacteraceae bacterium]|nr:hypothetical protein [Anaeromyxobacteraceae bacterium]
MPIEPSAPPTPAAPHRARTAVALVALALAAALFASTHVRITGGLYGVYLLTSASGRPLEIKDDLLLGDGPRLLGGIDFSWIQDRLHAADALPRLDLDWDEEEGSGIVTSHLADGRKVQTLFGRYVDSEGRTPHGLFVGGAIPEVSASREQNQSGMALHDARGWHHVWCNVNEGLLDLASGRMLFPGDWRFLGSRVLVDAPDRVVIESSHEVALASGPLRVERYAAFRSGRPFFRLGINFVNVGDQPVTIAYAYGDEPWVGEFGSAAGNVGWVDRGLVEVVTGVDPRVERWAGILDKKSGVANFMAWAGASPPDLVYFGNHPGTPAPEEAGAPLTSNEIFIGAEWRDRTLEPGETFTLRLTLGLAASRPDGFPAVPPDVVRDR